MMPLSVENATIVGTTALGIGTTVPGSPVSVLSLLITLPLVMSILPEYVKPLKPRKKVPSEPEHQIVISHCTARRTWKLGIISKMVHKSHAVGAYSNHCYCWPKMHQ